MFPEIDAPIVFFFDSRIKAGFGLQLHFTRGWYVHRQLIVEHDQALGHKIVFEPELVLGQWRLHIPDHVILEHVAGAQTGNSYMFLSEVGVNWSFASDGRGEILDIGNSGVHDRAIGFAHTHVVHVELFIGRAIAKDELSEAFDAGITLDLHAQRRFTLTGTVALKAVGSTQLFDDYGFL